MSRAFKEAKAKAPNAKKQTILNSLAKKYGPGRTKQSFKDSTDINKILAKAQKGGAISHVNKYSPEYGDFTDMPDLLEAHSRLERANEIFNDLPGEIKREFKQSPVDFFAWANDPENSAALAEKLSAMADVGDQRVVNPIRTAANMAASAPESASTAPEGADPESGTDAGNA